MEDLLGWMASAILLATLVHQITKQARDPESEGVSIWLFLGQATASALFLAYAWMLGNRVFIFTNGCLLLTALVGQWITWRRRRRS